MSQEQIQPKTIRLEKYQTTYAKVRLSWMIDHQQDRAYEMMQADKLKQYLTEIAEKAENLEYRLIQEGKTPEQAEEIALKTVALPYHRDEQAEETETQITLKGKQIDEILDHLDIMLLY